MTPRINAIILAVVALTSALLTLNARQEPLNPVTKALANLKAGNRRFVEETPRVRKLGPEFRTELLKGQKPIAIVLTDTDSRIAPEHVFDQSLGELVVVRVAGNVAGQEAIASIEEALVTLGTPLIVVMGNDDCATIKLALAAPELKSENLAALLKQVDVGKSLPKDPKDALAAATKNNVLRQAQVLTEKSNTIRKLALAQRVTIVPAVYALSSGKVDWLETAKPSGKQSALIRVILPSADARVWLDGMLTKSVGAERVFEVPPVDVDREFSYEIKAEWSEKGFKSDATKQVKFKGGTTVTVDFTK